MEVPTSPAAPKLLAQHISEVQPCEGGFSLPSLPAFDRVWVQGTVQTKLSGALKLDDGTGTVDVLAPVAAAAASAAGGGDPPGLELTSVQLGDYVLAVGKLLRRAQGGRQVLLIKAHKLLNLSHACREAESDAGAAEARAALNRRMLQWNLEVSELHRLLEESTAAGGAAAAGTLSA